MAIYIDADEIIKQMRSLGKVRISDAYILTVPPADVVERKDLDKITEAHEQIGYEKGYRDGYAQATVDVVERKKGKGLYNETL